MTDLFMGARWKIERSYVHIEEIERRCRDFAASDTHRIVTKFNPATGFNELVFEAGDTLPKFINLAFGDAVHNIRSALDHLFAAIVLRLDNNARIGKLGFPMRPDKQSFITEINNGVAEYAGAIKTPLGQTVAKVFIDEMNLYGAWDSPTGMLEPLIPTLRNFAQLISKSIDAVERVFTAHGTPP